MTNFEELNMTPKQNRERPLALVVNDTQEILDLFRDILTDEGWDVALTTFAPKDLASVIETDPDLVVLDFVIGSEEQGWQLLQKMKMHTQTRDIPIVVCSGALRLLRELEGQLVAKNVGVVLKPFDIDDLMATIDVTIKNSRNTLGEQDRETPATS
jgi:DNA-binding response OmpR family regulator